jgi:hypothetical protein
MMDTRNPNAMPRSLSVQPQDGRSYRHSGSYVDGDGDSGLNMPEPQPRRSQSTTHGLTLSVAQPSPVSGRKQPSGTRRSVSSASDNHYGTAYIHTTRFQGPSQHLPPIPGSPYITEASTPPSPISRKSTSTPLINGPKPVEKDSPERKSSPNAGSFSRSRTKTLTYVAHRLPPAQSLNAAVELLTSSSPSDGFSISDNSNSPNGRATSSTPLHPNGSTMDNSTFSLKDKTKGEMSPSPRQPTPVLATGIAPFWSRGTPAPNVAGKEISGPMVNLGKRPTCRKF